MHILNDILLIIDKLPITGIIDESLKQNNKYEHSSGLYYGGGGSYTKFIGEYGREISFQTITPYYEEGRNNTDRFNDYQELAKKASHEPVSIISTSNAEYNGMYILTNFGHTEDTNGNFEIEWSFKEIKLFNIKKSSFKPLKPPKYKKQKNNTKYTFKKHASSNTRYLLGKCSPMKKNAKGDCVRRLQRFLKSGGFYLKYKTDGEYGEKVTEAVKRAQKRRKIPSTGQWDEKTIKYYKKIYMQKAKKRTLSKKKAKKGKKNKKNKK